MKRDLSTSTIGRDEARKPLMKAYMFQRRVLFSCSCLMVLSLIFWIIAIATDHWIIISGGKQGKLKRIIQKKNFYLFYFIFKIIIVGSVLAY